MEVASFYLFNFFYTGSKRNGDSYDLCALAQFKGDFSLLLLSHLLPASKTTCANGKEKTTTPAAVPM